MTHKVVSVVETVEGNESMPCWRVGVRDLGTGRQYEHLFPKHMLEWRAAEYGVDPEDVDTLLTMILHEPHMGDPLPGSGAKNIGERLIAANNATDAREAHLARIKAHPVTIDVDSPHLDVIRKAPVDKAGVRDKTRAVDVNRWVSKHGDLPLPAPTGTPSHPKAPIADSMEVTLKAKESLTVIVGSGNGPDQR